MPKFLVTVIRDVPEDNNVDIFNSFTLAQSAYDRAKRDRDNLGVYLSIVIEEISR